MQAILLASFAVLAGQLASFGNQTERGKKLSLPRITAQLSIMPAAASLIGAYGSENNWPVFLILGAGVATGWMGFSAVALFVEAAVRAFKALVGLPTHGGKDDPK